MAACGNKQQLIDIWLAAIEQEVYLAWMIAPEMARQPR